MGCRYKKAHPGFVSFSTRSIVKEMAIMKKLLTVLAAGLFAAGAFAQAPAAPEAAPAATAAPAHMAKTPVKKHAAAHKKVNHKKASKHAKKAV